MLGGIYAKANPAYPISHKRSAGGNCNDDRARPNPNSVPQLPERIGNTPLIRLDRAVHGLEGITLLGKAEWANPSGSVTDRAAAALVRDARVRGLLTPGKTLLDASTGNTGISFAMLGAALGFRRAVGHALRGHAGNEADAGRIQGKGGLDRPGGRH